jgi:hypothetical protein
MRRDGSGRESLAYDTQPKDAVGWYLFLAELDVTDDRDKLPPVEGGYTIRLLGADDGAADIAWDGNPRQSPDEVLASASTTSPCARSKGAASSSTSCGREGRAPFDPPVA